MSKSGEIGFSDKSVDGARLVVSTELREHLANNNIRPEDGWKIFDQHMCVDQIKCFGKQIFVMIKPPLLSYLCLEDVTCQGPTIGIMVPEKLREQVNVVKDISMLDDPVCICPEGNCGPLIRTLEPGIYLKSEGVYLSFEKLLEIIPTSELKAFTSMLEKIKMER